VQKLFFNIFILTLFLFECSFMLQIDMYHNSTVADTT